MSYALDLAPEARRTLISLPVELQEMTLDRLDQIASRGGGSTPAGELLVSDFAHLLGSSKHYIFIVFTRDGATRTVHVKTIGHVVLTI